MSGSCCESIDSASRASPSSNHIPDRLKPRRPNSLPTGSAPILGERSRCGGSISRQVRRCPGEVSHSLQHPSAGRERKSGCGARSCAGCKQLATTRHGNPLLEAFGHGEKSTDRAWFCRSLPAWRWVRYVTNFSRNHRAGLCGRPLAALDRGAGAV